MRRTVKHELNTAISRESSFVSLLSAFAGFEEQGNPHHADDLGGHGKGIPLAPVPEGRRERPFRTGPVRLDESHHRTTAGRREGSTAGGQRHARSAIAGARSPARTAARAAGTAALRTAAAAGGKPV